MTTNVAALAAILADVDLDFLELSGDNTALDRAKGLLLAIPTIMREVKAFQETGKDNDRERALNAVASFRGLVDALETALEVKP